MGVEGPFPSKGLPVVRPRFGKTSSKSNKSLDSVKSDDSLTSLEWLSTMGNPTTPVLHSVYPPESQSYNIVDMISLAFRLSRKQVLSLTEISDMALRLAPHLSKDHIFRELSSNSQFVTSKNGWRVASPYVPSEAKKRKIDPDTNKRRPRRKPVPIELPQIPAQTVDIVIDPVNKRVNNNNPHQCPDLSELLNEIGLPEDTVTGNPFLQANKSQEMTFQTSMAASLPNLEITGEHIPAPKNWTSRDECSEIIVQDSSDRLYETHDVETPYMVESWLKDTFLDFTS